MVGICRDRRERRKRGVLLESGVTGDRVIDVALVHLVEVLFHDSDLVGHVGVAIEGLVVGVGLVESTGHLLHTGDHEDMETCPVEEVVGREEGHLLAVVDEGQFQCLLGDLEGRFTRVDLLVVQAVLLDVQMHGQFHHVPDVF